MMELNGVRHHPYSNEGLLNISNLCPVHSHLSLRPIVKNNGVFKNARPSRPHPLGGAERTEKYASTAKRRDRHWGAFSSPPNNNA